ncbi:uncharacterized protein K460DRAFT_416215 [Cucurbitaria berberidis CBS 394.84]|uniref:Uncharacterized protein n=1 Tax=Cucurbitaria berberidis CBS 394.84 TaxID=1168544 RepID=A0A9P4GFU2_9PLEO|nr:uncharacterized protein K460DRAFT_416215 [Cucurbitaria berberidis CBS 394.84]KAF1844847.1 hypothetical protein K460DRAFT_416215 [Cucurbitaria berberidis CBS 394.84]
MPQDHQDRILNRTGSGSDDYHHTRGPHQSNATPFSHNEPQSTYLLAPNPTYATPQRQSGHSEYDTPRITPYWDDFNGIIYEVPSISPRQSRNTYGRNIAATSYARGTTEAQAKLDHIARVPRGFEASGSDPNPRQGGEMRRPAPFDEGLQASKNRDSRNMDFDPTEARNSEALSRKIAHSHVPLGRLALHSKDVNQKLHEEANGSIKIAMTNRHALNNDLKTLPTPNRESRPVSESKIKRGAVFEVPRPGAKDVRPMSTLVEIPLPLRIFKEKNTKPTADCCPSSPTLNRVRKLREVEQKSTLAKLEEQLKSTKTIKPTRDDAQSRVSTETSLSPKAEELIPDMELSDSDWARSLYALADPPKLPVTSTTPDPELNPKREGMMATVHSVEDSGYSDDEEIDALIKAIADMRPFQKLPSTSAEHRSYVCKSAVPEGLDLSKIQTAKEQTNGISMPTTTHDAIIKNSEAEVVGVNHSESVESQKHDATVSLEYFARSASDDFERVEISIDEDTEHNGPKRKWYKGFRR